MKHLVKVISGALFACVLLLSCVVPAHAQGPGTDDGQIVFGGTYQLRSGDTLNGDLVILGGQGTLDNGSTVNGGVLIVGGTLVVSGEVDGSVTGIGALITLNDSAVVDGDVSTIGGTLNRSSKATIRGSIHQDSGGQFQINPSIPLPDLPGLENVAPKNVFSGLDIFEPILKGVGVFFRAIALAVLAALAMLFLHKPTLRVAHSIVTQPWISLGVGLLTILIAPGLLILLAITILLIPLSLIGFIVIGLAWLFGFIAVGLELGNSLSSSLKVSWAPPVNAGVGTLILSLVGDLFALIPCVGWVIPFLIGIIGLGGVILSRFGTTTYGNLPLDMPAATVPPVSVAPENHVSDGHSQENNQ